MPYFRRKKPDPPQLEVGKGHRGMATGSTKVGEQDFSKENVAKWEQIPTDEVKAFLYQGRVLPVHSTNVASLQYDYGAKQLVVEYLDGKAYQYDNVSEQEAYNFATFGSKGGAVWDILRVRGSKTAHRKPFRRVR